MFYCELLTSTNPGVTIFSSLVVGINLGHCISSGGSSCTVNKFIRIIITSIDMKIYFINIFSVIYLSCYKILKINLTLSYCIINFIIQIFFPFL